MTRWIKNLLVQNPTPQTPQARLGMETLDRRDLPSITFADYGVFQVTGDASNDMVTVTRDTKNTSSPYDDLLTVRRDYGSYGDPANNLFSYLYTESKTFPIYWPGMTLQLINSVKADLGNGLNEFTNSTSMTSTVMGGNEKDVFSGGSGQDIFFGRNGNDILIGNKGNDRLYGGDGTDQLYGREGTDGLYGGYGFDILDGGSGSDRYLQTQNPDFIVSKEANDAVLQFTNTSGWVLGPTAADDLDNEVFIGRSWSQSEIEKLDPALAVVHEATGRPIFLRTCSEGIAALVGLPGEDMVFRRVGNELVDPSGKWRDGKHVLAWNDNDGTITFDDYTFTGTDERIHEIALHELGHNWDDEDPVALWGSFKSLSSWTAIADASTSQLNGLMTGTYRVSEDGKWIYRASQQEFTRTYARTNPREDFAESFMMYWMHEMRETPTMASQSYNNMNAKMDFMSTFVDKVIDKL